MLFEWEITLNQQNVLIVLYTVSEYTVLNIDLLQACNIATRYCQTCTKIAFNDRNRVAKSWSTAEPWLGPLHDAYTRYSQVKCFSLWTGQVQTVGQTNYWSLFIDSNSLCMKYVSGEYKKKNSDSCIVWIVSLVCVFVCIIMGLNSDPHYYPVSLKILRSVTHLMFK